MLNSTKVENVIHQRTSLHWCWLSLAVVIIDQISKYLANHFLQIYQPLAVTPFFNLTLGYNKGAAWGFLHDTQIAIYAFSLVAIVVSIILFNWLRKTPAGQTLQAISLALLLGGAVGNLIDRIVHGYVIDFFDFYLGSWHFATFNVADAAITVGAGLLLLSMFILPRRHRRVD